MGRDFRVFFHTHVSFQAAIHKRECTRAIRIARALTAEPRSMIASCVYVHHPLARIKRGIKQRLRVRARFMRERLATL